MKELNKSVLLISAVVFMVQCVKKSDSVKPTNKVDFNSTDQRTELRYLKEVIWPKAYREQDTLLLDKILDESFELIDGSGNQKR